MAAGDIKVQPIMRFSLSVRPISGTSGMTCGVLMQQQIGLPMTGNGELFNSSLNLALALRNVRFSSSGTLVPYPSISTPFKANFGGEGLMKIDNRFHLLQYMDSVIHGSGALTTGIILETSLHPLLFAGTSGLNGAINLQLPISSDFTGSGELILRRLSAVNENILELININLLPGETVTIDTDLLQVLFGSKEDVSAVTSDSVFFELNPGENELIISTDSNPTLDVTAIWQNRWL
jgi:hypothetical protein